jgi:hypothetical protein
LRFELRVECASRDISSKLESVLSPDNESLPRDQLFQMIRHSKDLLFMIESARVTSAFSSLESLLSDINLFQEVWLLSHG